MGKWDMRVYGAVRGKRGTIGLWRVWDPRRQGENEKPMGTGEMGVTWGL